ncbi:hypothetical protein AB6P12_09885 [Streptococcus mutans]|uniref:hypothetical protein n=1 Tax=Streptococcus mutans TaxID=1309 RepID=UPI0038BD3227
MVKLEKYTIALARVVFHDKSGSKIRPVLLIRFDSEMVLALSITSQYSSKSESIKQKYFRIMDWSEAGLKKPSWVDTINILRFSPSTFSHFRVIGKLTQRDKIRFVKFYVDRRKGWEE